jgi:hypothetical protein
LETGPKRIAELCAEWGGGKQQQLRNGQVRWCGGRDGDGGHTITQLCEARDLIGAVVSEDLSWWKLPEGAPRPREPCSDNTPNTETANTNELQGDDVMGLRYNQMFPSRFWKAEDLVQPLTVKIKEVKIESLGGENGEEKPVVYFANEEKALALNKTNCVAIINAVGSDDTDDWRGQLIQLYKDTVMFHGQHTPCVRIRKPQQQKPKAPVVEPEPATESWEEEEIPDFDEPRR